VGNRAKYCRRARCLAVAVAGLATAPSVAAGDPVGAVVVVVAGFALYYIGVYAGAVGMAPID
jgi:uncharacterized membrane protein YjjP (DUF1212 family)